MHACARQGACSLTCPLLLRCPSIEKTSSTREGRRVGGLHALPNVVRRLRHALKENRRPAAEQDRLLDAVSFVLP